MPMLKSNTVIHKKYKGYDLRFSILHHEESKKAFNHKHDINDIKSTEIITISDLITQSLNIHEMIEEDEKTFQPSEQKEETEIFFLDSDTKILYTFQLHDSCHTDYKELFYTLTKKGDEKQ